MIRMSYDDALKLAKGLQQHCPESLKGGIVMSKSKDLDIAKQEAQLPATQAEPQMMGNIAASDLRLPRVALLQALSPQVQNEPDTYKQGQYINTLTQEVLPDPVTFIPVFPFKNVICWKPRSEGGGMLWKSMNFEDPKVKDAIVWKGQQKPIADVYVNVVCMIDGQDMPILISFCKTSLTAGFNLTTLMQLSGFGRYKYQLVSEKKKNDKGQYYVMRAKRGAATTPEEQAAARQLYEAVKGMSIDTDYETSTMDQAPIDTADNPDGL